jgi:hypothetical protein
MTHPIPDPIPDPIPERTPDAPVLLQVRPRRITILASIAATLVIGSMVVIGLLLRDTNEGVTFTMNDQIGLIGIGLVFGAVIMTAARPRLRADEDGMAVRNVFGETFVPWPLVVRVAFPPGAHWAELQMPDDEVKAVMAIQAMDRGRAVTALERLRALHQRYAPPPPVSAAAPVERPGPTALDPQRPLGRLEIIDRQKAAERDRDLAAKTASGVNKRDDKRRGKRGENEPGEQR